LLEEQGYEKGSCLINTPSGRKRACRVTLAKNAKGIYYRLIHSWHLSRPEHYLSIYQSGCNHSCKKCHSAYFAQSISGQFISTDDIKQIAEEYVQKITVWEPKERAAMFYATDLCRGCGSCVIFDERGSFCPNQLKPEQIIQSPQGWGPARNIIAFTGGDLTCQPYFYAQAAKRIKEVGKDIWVLIETNGYGLTPFNLDILAKGGVDAFWLDVKAYDRKKYKSLCGTSNKTVLSAIKEIKKRGFMLEVLVLFIPGMVVCEDILKVVMQILQIDYQIPLTILAFFPSFKMRHIRPPSLQEMVETYQCVRQAGMVNVKLGNCGVFVKNQQDWSYLLKEVGPAGIG
jgi:pyruvate-formate lyase-activating enzyme